MGMFSNVIFSNQITNTFKVSYISLIRGSTHLLALFLEAGESAEKALLVFDLVSSLVNFGLEQAACISEIDDGSSWKDYDGEVTSMTSVSSGLNAIAAIGYFTAFMFKGIRWKSRRWEW